MFKRLIVVSAWILAAPTAALADSFNYTYFQASYARLDDDRLTESLDGLNVVVSAGVAEYVFVGAEYTEFGEPTGGTENLSQVILRAGMNTPISGEADLFGSLDYFTGDWLTSAGVASDSGVGAEVGIRTMVMGAFELDGTLRYQDVKNDGGTSVTIGAVIPIADPVALVADLEKSSDALGVIAGLRLIF